MGFETLIRQALHLQRSEFKSCQLCQDITDATPIKFNPLRSFNTVKNPEHFIFIHVEPDVDNSLIIKFRQHLQNQLDFQFLIARFLQRQTTVA